ncbi:MAG: hypothetical protein GF350_00595 [Chitinivibrionales bacterium]|nr:hypothetical protein [Chitinivibrionales bacterium]
MLKETIIWSKAVLLGFLVFSSVTATNAGGYKLLATASQVEHFCGTKQAKIVFVTSDHKMFYIDFAESENPSIHAFQNVAHAAVPMISPNGEWVAFATGTIEDAASVAPSTAWVVRMSEDASPIRVSPVDSGFVPRFVQDQIDIPRVVYSTCGDSDNGYIWQGCGKVVTKPADGTSSVETIWNGGSFLGGLSFDNRYLVTAENSRNAFIFDLQNPDSGPAIIHNIHARNVETQADTVFSLQTCNPSVSASRVFTDALMYLDMGAPYALAGDYVNDTLGSGWGFHSRLFLARSDGRIYKFFDSPREPSVYSNILKDSADIYNGWPSSSGARLPYSWHHSEWTNHPYFASLILKVNRRWYHPDIKPISWLDRERGERLQLLNMKNRELFTVLGITDTSYEANNSIEFVHAWIKIDDSFQEDESWLETPEMGSDVSAKPGHRYSKSMIRHTGARTEFYNVKGQKLNSSLNRPGGNRIIPAGIIIMRTGNGQSRRLLVNGKKAH